MIRFHRQCPYGAEQVGKEENEKWNRKIFLSWTLWTSTVSRTVTKWRFTDCVDPCLGIWVCVRGECHFQSQLMSTLTVRLVKQCLEQVTEVSSFFLPRVILYSWVVGEETFTSARGRKREWSITCRKEIHKWDLSNASIFPPKPYLDRTSFLSGKFVLRRSSLLF